MCSNSVKILKAEVCAVDCIIIRIFFLARYSVFLAASRPWNSCKYIP